MNYQLSELGVSFSKDRLDNNVGVFLFNKIGAPICIRTTFFAGSRFDSIPGIAHFLEHMLVAGTKKFPSKDKLAEPLERIGGRFSASTSLNYHAIFNNTALERRVIGNKDSVNKIFKQDLLKYKDTFLNTGRISFLVSGDITMNECLSLLTKYLNDNNIEKRFSIPRKADINRGDYFTYIPFQDNKQVYVKMGFRTIGLNESDREIFSLGLVAGILGKGRASRLVKELRYKRGLVYSISAGQYNYPDAGHFVISTSFEHGKLENILKIIINELERIAQDGISEYEFEFTKSATVKSVFNTMQTSWSWINIHEDEMVFNPELARTIDYFMNEINSLTLEEVNAVARKYLHKDNFYLALCGTDKKPTILW